MVWESIAANRNFSDGENHASCSQVKDSKQETTTHNKTNQAQHEDPQQTKNAIPEALLSSRWDCMQVGLNRTASKTDERQPNNDGRAASEKLLLSSENRHERGRSQKVTSNGRK